MKIYVDNRIDQRRDFPDDELVLAFWSSEDGQNAVDGLQLERCLLSFLSRYGTFNINEEGTGYDELFDKVRIASPDGKTSSAT